MDTPSPQRPITDAADAIAGALAWWRDAGLSHAYGDAVQPWLPAEAAGLAGPAEAPSRHAAPASPAERPPAPAAPPSIPPVAGGARIGGDPAGWPQDLAAFPAWWLNAPGLAPATGPRVPPRGGAGAEIMAIVAMPEPEDGETLLAGPRGAMLSSIFAAMAVPADRTYLASALPRPQPLPDWGDLAARGLDDVVAHHIALVAPQRVIVFGLHILPRLGHALPHTAARLDIINQKGRANTPGLPDIYRSLDLDTLIDRPGSRARFWREWLDWSA